ncbi:MAG: hypothetical protein C0596_13355 [Marinilabiliales bacterium]|nr:MAG: hypothetical protein C0596_13355 [Marinilabiliales bacterium]
MFLVDIISNMTTVEYKKEYENISDQISNIYLYLIKATIVILLLLSNRSLKKDKSSDKLSH